MDVKLMMMMMMMMIDDDDDDSVLYSLPWSHYGSSYCSLQPV